MNKKLKYALLLPILGVLASCGGYSLDYIVDGDRYLSADFNKNYYTSWNAELTESNKNPVKTFNEDDIFFIEEVSDAYLFDRGLLVKPDAEPSDPDYHKIKYLDVEEYGEDYKLNSLSDCFNYGVQSKLFDGISYCRSRYQRVRVQANRSGFSVRLSKESDALDYFAIHFKATTNNQIKCYKVGTEEYATKDSDLFHTSTFDLTISIYCKNDNSGIDCYNFAKHIEFNGTTNNGSESNYKFVSFQLKDLPDGSPAGLTLRRCVGFSVQINNLQDELITWNKNKGVSISEDDYALFIYEVFMPHTYWH